MNGSKLLKNFNIELEMECEKAGVYIEESDLHSKGFQNHQYVSWRRENERT